MQEHNHSTFEPVPGTGSFWKSPTGIVLIVFLVIAAILLGYEHRVHIFGGNAGSVLLLFAWIGLHLFMHRGHGGHGGHGEQAAQSDPKAVKSREQIKESEPKP